MKLSKEQIQFIDQYLIKNEVKFWDVRAELLDHIASAVEEDMQTNNLSFKAALLKSHRAFGNQYIKNSALNHNLTHRLTDDNVDYNKALYQSNIGFKKFLLDKQKEIGRKRNKAYFKTFRSFLCSKAFLLEYVAILSVVFFTHQLNPKVAFILAMAFCLLSELIKVSYYFANIFKSKSLSLEVAIISGSFLTSGNSFIIFGFNHIYEDVLTKPYHFLSLFYLFLFPLVRHSLNLFLKTIKETKAHYKMLID